VKIGSVTQGKKSGLTGLPDSIPKQEDIYQMAIKWSKLPHNIKNDHKIYQIAVTYTNIIHSKAPN
jgi:hypothetical protein